MYKWLFLALALLLTGCSDSDKSGLQFSEKGREVPEFNADTVYKFVQQQVDFGPRVPNTEAHRQAEAYFVEKLKEYAGPNAVFVQEFTAEGYDEQLELGNVIAAFNLSAQDRIMISAHWDSRPRADMDSTRQDEGIVGADDGGSGVAVLLELARMFSENPPPIGVDIVLFDGEDYGESGSLEKYFLGSRYWSNNPPVPGYSPRFGILLDMVGAEGAQFPKERYSLNYAPNLVEEVWNIAAEKGYEDYFLNEEGAAVSDDHVIVNEQARIPIINIINHSRTPRGNAQFAPHWHTHNDNMDIISRETLQAVGDVMAELIYNRL
ncbi:M28 family peptidase [Gracilimonas sediminicola]|uniref:M28 family peptidase n=1 Tax=Gracilimonas sediminicola TaxID=2952158 RepID=A0A9X2RHQ9_9BACT|nr:M28 family peptidase [Gracilimonas sediminicola]MCP9292573.1 M28 family peptidase [Gracilimonas sediminicola]